MKKISSFLIILLTPIFLFSHSLVLSVMDNEDGTITVQGVFNTGQSAAGALLILEALHNKEILYEKRLPASNELTVDIPKIPYQIVLDGGEGHTVIKDGIAPPEGFKEVKTSKENKEKPRKRSRTDATIATSNAVTISIIIAFVLLFATIFISIKNTNKLLLELKNK
ncbi:hypothetical protein CP960_05510 [Malaciobacter halophilus]|uniref:Uncharacterized protein n=1 Tax=Malaciobacter halophilus TaxID=197482 RepID=A0A2N1J3Y1_9BACT|nr:hypothetical protein [Malaciobacter halophilus]AXH08793.1 putative membrane protein [Malaciobacter halophilus]PKI81204.1 hypothetical protein CP960_05510 [Malaciobacter halophilus]